MSTTASNYERITDSIIEAMEKGEVVWQKPWKSIKPCNAITGKAYRGINPWLLALNGEKYTDHRWLTYNQAKELGGNVKKGEKSTMIVFFSPVPKKNKDTGEVNGTFWLLKSYIVFNVEQCENLVKLAPLDTLVNVNQEKDPNIVAEEIWNNYLGKPSLETGDVACYLPSQDKILMPRRETFKSNAFFYAILFHESGHSTGAKNRLNRPGVAEFDNYGSEKYSKEELIAEFTSAFLCAEAGLEAPTRDNSVAYLQNWIQALKDDKTLIVKAATAAQKAAEHILGTSAKNDEPEPSTSDEKELVNA
jgi:antirestriction protein ArdC